MAHTILNVYANILSKNMTAFLKNVHGIIASNVVGLPVLGLALVAPNSQSMIQQLRHLMSANSKVKTLTTWAALMINSIILHKREVCYGLQRWTQYHEPSQNNSRTIPTCPARNTQLLLRKKMSLSNLQSESKDDVFLMIQIMDKQLDEIDHTYRLLITFIVATLLYNTSYMGTCVFGKPYPREPVMNKGQAVKQSKFSQLQEQLLSKMYTDLAKRSKNNIVSRQIFEVFFHASGLMAELLFLKFDKNKSGQISKEDFLQAFELMVKGRFEERADVLFEFYGVENSGGIRYSQLLKILFSYPVAQLNKMLFEEHFLKYLGENMLTYYFGPERKIEDKTIIEETSEPSSTDLTNRKVNVYSVYAPNSHEYIEMQTRIRQTLKQQRQKIGVPDIFKKERHSIALPSVPHEEQNKIGSSTQVQLKKARKSAQLKSNIASVTKRYATFLFVSQNLDKEKDVFSKANFYKLLTDHPSIFDAYLSGFHNYVWQVTAEGPEFQRVKLQIEGPAKEVSGFGQQKVHLRFIRTTLFIFPHKISKIPKDLINLQGLAAHPLDRAEETGIRITHRDGIYPEREFLFESKSIRDDWMKQLADFKELSVFDKFLKLQRIGGGNFSNVYRGKDKLTDKFVAIKVIQLPKLTEGEREVLKRECGILRQVHHPNIVKYYQEFKTKTHLYIVTELLSEGDLFEYTRKNTFLEEYQAASIFRQLVDTILYLNQSGIIHRDLKPENVMIIMGEDKKMVKRVKLIDFGFGVYKDKLKDLTDRQKYAGTPGFIAPQVYQMKDYDEKIDTFSLGIILYFMLYGYLPFQSNYIEEIQEMTIGCNISLRNNHWSNVSEEAKDLIMKILTPAATRITTKQALQHPWLQNIERLKEYQGRNKKQRILF